MYYTTCILVCEIISAGHATKCKQCLLDYRFVVCTSCWHTKHMYIHCAVYRYICKDQSLLYGTINTRVHTLYIDTMYYYTYMDMYTDIIVHSR